MFRPHSPPTRRSGRPPARRGAILLVVLTLLALFAVIGLSFVLYAESEANAARIHRQGADRDPGDEPPDAEDVAGEVVSQILFGTNDPRSVFTGHDLASLKYGGDPTFDRTTPYNGVGLFHERLNDPAGPAIPYFTGLPPFNRSEVVLYAVVEKPFGDANKTTKFDAERTKGDGTVRTGAGWAGTTTNPNVLPIYVPKNAPYTYPDRNNALLAMVNTLLPTDTANNPAGIPAGQVLLPSGVRPKLFDPNGAYGVFGLNLRNPTDPNDVNPNWFVPTGRFKQLRPRSIDHMTTADVNGLQPTELAAYTALRNNTPLTPAQLTLLAQAAEAGRLGQFPVPAFNADGSVTGDVQNYKYPEGAQRNDSVWMSLNLPPVRYKGKLVQPLVAPLLIALDGRVNTTVAGNLLNTSATPPTHASRDGFGPHEINLAKVLMLAQAQGMGAARAQAIIQKRFGRSATAPADPLRQAPLPPEFAVLAGAGPSNAAAVASAGTTPGEHYPSYPSPAAVFAVHPFQPLDRPATVQNPGPNSVLGVNQYAVPAGSQVSWSGLGAKPVPPGYTALMTTRPDMFGGTPRYDNYDSSQFLPANPSGPPAEQVPRGALVNHPLLWNPYARDQFAGNSAPADARLFPTSDARRLLARWSDKDSNLAQTYMASQTDFQNEFRGGTPNSPSSRTRALTTPFSNHTKAAGVAPNFFGNGPKLGMATGQRTPALSGAPTFDLTPGSPTAIPNSTTLPAAVFQASLGASDASPTANPAVPTDHNRRLANVRAALAAVDLNRPLRDYRANPTAPGTKLDNVSVTPASELEARRDRQAFASDIFLRLAVATGASIRYENGQWLLPRPTGPGMYEIAITTPVSVSEPEYNALRWLAQLTANIVDAVDPDDVSTPFVWNPQTFNDQQNADNYASDPTVLANVEANGQVKLNNRVVFGTEKPRLTINEVHGEAANSHDEPAGGPDATKAFQARFFVELLNPTNREPNPAPGQLPLQPQDVPLNYGAAHPVYRMQVFDRSPEVRTALGLPSNVTGDVLPLSAPERRRINTPLTDLYVAQPAADNLDATLTSQASVEPNGGAYLASTDATNNRRGFALIGPAGARPMPTDPPAPLTDDGVAYAPGAAAPFNMMLQKPSTATPGAVGPDDADRAEMAYFLPLETKQQIDTAGVVKTQLDNRHAILLQRLANPYLPPSVTNPFVTVDVVYDVKLADAIKKAKGPGGTRTPAPKRGEHASIGRVQPYAGFQSPTAFSDLAATDMTMSLTLRQLRVSQPPGGAATTLAQTFMRHNGETAFDPTNPTTTDPTLSFPFEWLPHFDRRLINQAELLNVAAVMPHELTQRFAAPNPTPGQRPTFHQHAAELPLREQPAVGATAPAAPQVFPPLYRAMEYLTVKPWTRDNPEGGRTAGKINVNMIWDRAVFDALIDEQSATSGNRFTAAEVNELWTQFKLSRSPNYPYLGNTADEAGVAPGLPVDRPFKAFGVGKFDGGGNLAGVPSAPTAPQPPFGLEDTLLRKTATTDPMSPVFGKPLFSRYTVPATPRAADDPVHPYAESEMLRKVLNNVTTTSDTFLFAFTVGYFEVREGVHNDANNPIVLGREVFNQVPGDLRKQYSTVLDRSNLHVAPPLPDSVGAPAASWVAELQNRIQTTDPTTGLPVTTPVRPQLLLANPPPLDSGWTGPPSPAPPQSDGKYNVRNPSTMPGEAPGEYIILPRLARDTGGNPVPSQMLAVRTYQLSGRYDGKLFEMYARFNPDPAATQQHTGTQFAVGPKGPNVGLGDRQAVLEAYVDDSPAGQWTYDAVNGRVRIAARVVSSNLAEYPAGTVLSNVTFGLPAGASPKFELNAPPNPAVPFFGELRP